MFFFFQKVIARAFYVKLHSWTHCNVLYTSNMLISFTSYVITSITSFFEKKKTKHMIFKKSL
jgi:hypothetical protein